MQTLSKIDPGPVRNACGVFHMQFVELQWTKNLSETYGHHRRGIIFTVSQRRTKRDHGFALDEKRVGWQCQVDSDLRQT